MWSTVCELIRLRAKKPKEERIEPKAADAEPVIRCKYCNKNGKLNCSMAYWDMETGEITWWNKPDEYCSRAERKEE